MLLIKCSCGCHATLNSNFFSNGRLYRCQNCEKRLQLNDYDEMRQLSQALDEQGFKLYSIPDDATIDFQFNVNK